VSSRNGAPHAPRSPVRARVLSDAYLALLAGCLHTNPAPPQPAAPRACTLFLDEPRDEPACLRVDASGALNLTEAAQRRVQAAGTKPVGLASNGRLYYGRGTVRETLNFDNGPDYFVEGLARTVEGGKIGFMDAQLELRIAPQWDFAFPFEDGVAAVCNGCKDVPYGEHRAVVGGKWGYIDTHGRVLVPVSYDQSALPPVPHGA